MSGYEGDEVGGIDPDAEAFRAVTDTPTPDYLERAGSPLEPEQIERLKAELDEKRIRRRDGRGGGKFEYIAIHDAIRTANAIFGFGAWGHEVVEQERIGEVPVESKGDNPKPGYHVAYRTVVRLTVKGCVSVSGTGYGDGVEYGGETAKLTASELALKESESDALKRALVKFGDQFGLILYAKVDEKKRIESERRGEDSTSREPTKLDHEIPLPTNWADVMLRLETAHPAGGWDLWLNEAATVQFGKPLADLPAQVRKFEAFQRCQATVVKIEEGMKGGDFPPPTRNEIRAAFSYAWDGAVLDGPPYRLSPDETDRPTAEEWETAQAAETGRDEPGEAALKAEADAIDEAEGDAEARQDAAEAEAAEAALTGPSS